MGNLHRLFGVVIIALCIVIVQEGRQSPPSTTVRPAATVQHQTYKVNLPLVQAEQGKIEAPADSLVSESAQVASVGNVAPVMKNPDQQTSDVIAPAGIGGLPQSYVYGSDEPFPSKYKATHGDVTVDALVNYSPYRLDLSQWAKTLVDAGLHGNFRVMSVLSTNSQNLGNSTPPINGRSFSLIIIDSNANGDTRFGVGAAFCSFVGLHEIGHFVSGMWRDDETGANAFALSHLGQYELCLN